MKIFKAIIVLLLCVAFIYVTVGEHETFDVYGFMEALRQWGQTPIPSKVSTGIEIIDNIFAVPPMSFFVDLVYVLSYAFSMIYYITVYLMM